MVKKIAALTAAGAILLSVAVPVLARRGGGRGGQSGESKNIAIVLNGAAAVANTGGNLQGNGADVYGDTDGVKVSGGNTMTTGEADAEATAVVIANTHVGCCDEPDDDCGRRCGKGDDSDHTDLALVGNGAIAGADSGYNVQGNVALVDGEDDEGGQTTGYRGGYRGGHHEDDDGVEVSGDNDLTTGKATSTADAWVVVNTHWLR